MIRTTLHDGWTLRFLGGPVPAEIPSTIEATVPGTVHTDLLAHGLIPDPYLDENERTVAWIGETDVRYDLDFSLDAADFERVDLVCEGLDTIATLSLNGRTIGATRNQHRSYRFDVRDVITSGENQLGIAFASALNYAREAEKRMGVRPAVGNAYPYNAIRKMACNFGWDWGPVLITAGIVKPISIERWSTARLASVRPVVAVGADGVGEVELHVAVERTRSASLTLAANIRDPRGNVVASVAQALDEDGIVLRLAVPEAHLWWPRGYGEQPLYQVTVDLLVDTQPLDQWTKHVGFRTIRVDITPDAIGTGFTFHVNDQPVFIKGANWIPDDCFLPRVTPQKYESSIRDATEAGMNLLRVWGGGIYESDVFYDLCDREGLLVWQDFALACAAYSEDAELWDEIDAEARENVVRLASHPSLAIWNGGNENIEGYYHWGWKEVLDSGESWGSGYYDRLLPGILCELDPGRAYIPSSPFNPADPSDPRNSDNGPVHEWEVWNRQDYSYFRTRIPRFVAEFGFGGPPAFSTIERAMGDDSRTPESSEILWHHKADEGNAKLETGIAPHLPLPTSFDDWHFALQLNQARAITYGIEHFRSHWPRTAGSIIWQLNDCWPATSWAAVDGDKRRKPLWYALRSVNADRLLTFQPRERGLALVASNDSAEPWQETLTVRRVSLDGRVLATQVVEVLAATRTNATVLIDVEVATPDDASAEIIVVESGFARRAIWYFVEDIDLRLPDLDITTAVDPVVGGYVVTITANAFVKDLVLAADRLHPAATVDELFITLLPGESKRITIFTPEPLDTAQSVRHPVLNSVNNLLSLAGTNRLGSP